MKNKVDRPPKVRPKVSFKFIDSGVIKSNPYLVKTTEPILSGEAADAFLADQLYGVVKDAVGGGLDKCSAK